MTTTTADAVVGVFTDPDLAAAAVHELRDAGFSDDQIGVATRTGGLTEGTPAGASGPPTWETGAAIGMMAGATIAGLALGPAPVVLAAGFTALLGGALTGGLIGALIDLGIPETDARWFHDEVKAGKTLVTVRAGGRAAEAAEVLRRVGAQAVRSTRRDGAGKA